MPRLGQGGGCPSSTALSLHNNVLNNVGKNRNGGGAGRKSNGVACLGVLGGMGEGGGNVLNGVVMG